jgi:hypothetical protein
MDGLLEELRKSEEKLDGVRKVGLNIAPDIP